MVLFTITMQKEDYMTARSYSLNRVGSDRAPELLGVEGQGIASSTHRLSDQGLQATRSSEATAGSIDPCKDVSRIACCSKLVDR